MKLLLRKCMAFMGARGVFILLKSFHGQVVPKGTGKAVSKYLSPFSLMRGVLECSCPILQIAVGVMVTQCEQEIWSLPCASKDQGDMTPS